VKQRIFLGIFYILVDTCVIYFAWCEMLKELYIECRIEIKIFSSIFHVPVWLKKIMITTAFYYEPFTVLLSIKYLYYCRVQGARYYILQVYHNVSYKKSYYNIRFFLQFRVIDSNNIAEQRTCQVLVYKDKIKCWSPTVQYKFIYCI